MVVVEYILLYSFIIITLFISKREKREILYSNQYMVELLNQSTKVPNILRVTVLLLYSLRVLRFGRCSLMHSASSVKRNWSLRVVEHNMDTSSVVGSVFKQVK